MVFKNKKVKKVLRLYKKLFSIEYALRLIDWDIHTYMPEEEGSERGVIIGELEKIYKDFLQSKEFVNAVKEASKEKNLNDYEKGVIRVLLREIEIYEKLPKEFIEEFSKVVTEASKAWERAKKKSNFELFQPYLEKIFELSRKKAEYLGYKGSPYNALLNLFEEGLTCKDVDKMFKEIRLPLRKLIRKITSSKNFKESHPLEMEEYKKEKMKELNKKILEVFGYDFRRARIDESMHPFTEGIGSDDVRITSWYSKANFKESLLATIHEFGHALYELQIDQKLIFTPIATGVSLGIHESQSRFWENLIGRSKEFISTMYQTFKEYMPFLRKYEVKDVYFYFNLVKPSLIRVKADEVTYNMHIMLRYKIEKDLIEENIVVNEIPSIWNDEMEKLLGITPKNDSEGCLQDVHWSEGGIGYFPTYSIGTILASQIKLKMEKDIGKLNELILQQEYGKIKNWLEEKIHRYGSTYAPKELIKRVVGRINARPFLNYLKKKYLQIY